MYKVFTSLLKGSKSSGPGILMVLLYVLGECAGFGLSHPCSTPLHEESQVREHRLRLFTSRAGTGGLASRSTVEVEKHMALFATTQPTTAGGPLGLHGILRLQVRHPRISPSLADGGGYVSASLPPSGDSAQLMFLSPPPPRCILTTSSSLWHIPLTPTRRASSWRS